ncbi:hypothetical protein CBL_13443 [Carabus blaptoides fortunei]
MSVETVPEEIIINILLYLSPIDRFNFGKTCKLFNRISLDRIVLKKVDFSHNYTFRTVHWKQITRQACAHLVHTLNLNGITWLSNSELISGLARMVNLEKLFLLDANISTSDLKTVFKTTMKIKKLAISLKPDTCGGISNEYIKLPLTHLMVTYNGYGVQSLARFLTQFEELQELWLIEPMIPFKYEIAHDRDWINFGWPKIPKVTKRIVLSRQFCAPSNHSELITKLQASDGNWLYLEQINDDSLFYVVENFDKKDAKLPTFDLQNDFDLTLHRLITDFHTTQLICASDKRDMIIKNLLYHEMYYSCLNLTQSRNRDFHSTLEFNTLINLYEKLLFSPNMTKLNRICCDRTPFWQTPVPIMISSDLFKRRRMALQPNEANENCRFARFTKHTPHVKDFELVRSTVKIFGDVVWPPDSLKYLRNWKELNKLVITCDSISNGKFLIEVAMHCTQLRILKLKDNTLSDLSPDVCKALVHCKNLRDFRFERKCKLEIDPLFEALTHCTALERLFIQCTSVEKFSKEPIERTITSCTNLHFMFIYILRLPDVVCKQVNRDLRKLRKLPFVAKVVGQNFTMENIRYRDVSIYHIQDIMTHSNYPYFEFIKNF